MDMDFDYGFMSDDEVKQMFESILDGVQEEVPPMRMNPPFLTR